MRPGFSRRELLAAAPLAGAALIASPGSEAHAAPAKTESAKPTFRYCLNTSTIRGQKLPLPEVVDIAGKAGYDAIEPWINEIEAYVQAGGKLPDLKKRIADHGLTVESAIGFAEWVVNDPDKRAKGMERAKHDMDLVKQIGGVRIAAPPAGAYTDTDIDLFEAAQRYRALLELGQQMDVVPEVEFWGGAKSLYRLAQSVFIAVESGHPNACLLPDVYHIFRGGSNFSGIKLLDGAAIHVFHLNDYPGDVPREQQDDSHRVYPGDGVAPLEALYQDLAAAGFCGFLSLELFNKQYWSQDPLHVACTGLAKMKESVAKAKV